MSATLIGSNVTIKVRDSTRVAAAGGSTTIVPSTADCYWHVVSIAVGGSGTVELRDSGGNVVATYNSGSVTALNFKISGNMRFVCSASATMSLTYIEFGNSP